jgi:predicted enzyme related to lactoylglutathione lyase
MEYWQPNHRLQPTRLSPAQIGGSTRIQVGCAAKAAARTRPAAEPGTVRRAMELHMGKGGASMGSPRQVDTYLKVKDMDRAVSFYETFLGVKAKYRYQGRWASITDGLGLYNPTYDVENDVPMTEYDREVRMGNNVVVVFGSDDIEREHDRVKTIGATDVTDIVEINLMAPYRFFQFQDTEGNVIEVGRMG